MNQTLTPGRRTDHTSRLLTAGVVLALLYLGRSVLIPLALAIMLSLLLASPVRSLRHVGIGRISSVFVAVAALVLAGLGIAAALSTQVVRIAASLPQYESNVQHKLTALEEVAVGPILRVTDETTRLMEVGEARRATPASIGTAERGYRQPGPERLVQSDFGTQPLQLLWKAMATLWHPVQFAAIVLLVLIFVLLEHESLRDRLIHIAGATDIRSATLALNDAGERLSRYFISQALVNVSFGLAIWMTLALLGVPQALLCGVLAGILRFVPYLGVALAALFTAALAVAVDPGWSLAVVTLGVFILLDVVVGQLVEPHLYGHATGLSPLSVVVAAIFWSWLWGPVGLILSTPLTLCLLVAGRHIRGLGTLELLLGNTQPLTWPQRFYQRALSGDPHEIITNAREFLRSDSLAAYCDRVMIPALHMARLDAAAGAATELQQEKIHRVIADVAAALSGESLRALKRRHRGAVLDELNAGRWLREERERLIGKWQGPLGVPRASIVICLALGSPADDLAAELLVRLLRSEHIDARHFSSADLGGGLPPGANPDGVAIIFLVSAFPGEERERADAVSRQARALLPHARLLPVFCPGVEHPPETLAGAPAEPSARSLAEAVQIAVSWRQVRGQADSPALPTPATWCSG